MVDTAFNSMKGLQIKQPFLNDILAGKKIWEIRGRNTIYRGPVALIQSGGNKILGVAEIIEVKGPLSVDEYKENVEKHGDVEGAEQNSLPYSSTYAWVFGSVRRLEPPIEFRPPRGAIVWVKIPQQLQQRINKQVSMTRVYLSAKDELRRKFLESLAEDLRFVGHEAKVVDSHLSVDLLFIPKELSSEQIKDVYKRISARMRAHNQQFIAEMEKGGVLSLFINGKDLKVENIRPELRICREQKERDIFRYCRLLQSVPTSPGVGRRFSALIFDTGQKNPILMGAIGLSETSYRLGDRDRFLGWLGIDSRQKEKETRNLGLKRLKQLSVCMAVPPYNYLFGAKLAAFLAMSEPLQEYHLSRYHEPLLGLVTTCATNSNHCAIYNRLNLNRVGGREWRRNSSELYLHIGQTSPYTFLFVSDRTFELAKRLVRHNGALEPDDEGVPSRFAGRNSILRRAARLCGVDKEVFRLNAKALYFGYLHENNLEILRRPAATIEPMLSLSPEKVIEYWKKFWLEKGIDSKRFQKMQQFRNETLAMSED